ncbi:hypothetical protein ACIRFH_10380 [Streptomyces sp. NPDC093586]|uniref:hypothetical protein n=1 Tax=Streptomyces sp. NPDC093586 TaxID=3366042 RepID=UPI0037F89A5A
MHRSVPADAGTASATGDTSGAGGDDFALHGDTYGTLLVDATTRLPLTLREGRYAEQPSQWLREYPGVEAACHDGPLIHRQGITALHTPGVGEGRITDVKLWKRLTDDHAGVPLPAPASF